MNLNELLISLNLGNVCVIIALVLSLIQISPIKINPWSAFGRWIRKQLALEEIKDDLMDARRTRILRFDDELIEHKQHRKDMFDAILVDCDKYEKYCKEHKGYINSVANDSIKHIKEVYAELKRDNTFLVDKTKGERKNETQR